MDKVVIILILVVLFSMMVSSIGGGAFLYLDEPTPTPTPTPTTTPTTTTTTGTGSGVPPSGAAVDAEYATAPVESGTTACAATLCTGSKVMRTKPDGGVRMGTTVDICCRDKACQIDWDPAMGGDPEKCREQGMVFNEDYVADGKATGKTNDECCKVDTTSYSKWCVQEVAHKLDGTKEKTPSPFPWYGGYVGSHADAIAGKAGGADVHWARRVAGSVKSYQFGGDPAIALRRCKGKCDDTSNCQAIHLETDGTCRLQKASAGDAVDGLLAGYEKNNILGTGLDHPKSGEFYIKSGFVPADRRTSGPTGAKKIAGVDEDYCPLKYTSIYGNGNWDSGNHPGMHMYPNVIHNSKTNGCYGAGTTHEGVTLMGANNSPEPIVRRCSELCEKFDDCGGFWAYTSGTAAGKCCLKNEVTATAAAASTLARAGTNDGAYFVRNKDGVMGNRPSRLNTDHNPTAEATAVVLARRQGSMTKCRLSKMFYPNECLDADWMDGANRGDHGCQCCGEGHNEKCIIGVHDPPTGREK